MPRTPEARAPHDLQAHRLRPQADRARQDRCLNAITPAGSIAPPGVPSHVLRPRESIILIVRPVSSAVASDPLDGIPVAIWRLLARGFLPGPPDDLPNEALSIDQQTAV